MLGFANAKINLGLHILGRRDDGYHEIETIFYPVYQLRDIVEVVEASSVDIVQTGIELDIPLEKNLVHKAYKLLSEEYNLPPVMFFLHKIIPFGAGLGGGSADAAKTLELLNSYFDLGIGQSQLADYASKLGADCAFFIYNRPMLARGIGNDLLSVDLDLSGYNIVIVKPDFTISTAEAYSLVKPVDHSLSLLDVIKYPVEHWRDYLVNDFERFLFSPYPLLKEIKQILYEKGALYVSLSGSGSAMFAIFDRYVDITDIQDKFPFIWQSKNWEK